MYSNYELAQAMLVLGRGEQKFGEIFHRAWDAIDWAEDHLTDHEQNQITRLAEALQ